jgi:ankyrin repeat protein
MEELSTTVIDKSKASKRRFSEVDDVANQLELASLKKKNKIDPKTITQLFIACKQNNVDYIKQILKENEIDPGISKSDGRTPMIVAAMHNSNDVGCILANSKISNIDKVDSYNKTALFYASQNGNADFVKSLIRNRITDMSQIILQNADVIQVYNSFTTGKFKRKCPNTMTPRVKAPNAQSNFREKLGEIYDHKCIFTGVPIKDCDHQFISSPKQHGESGYSTDNGILISKHLNRAFYKKGKIKFDKESILDFDADFVMVRVTTQEMDIIDINQRMIKIQRTSIPFII